MDTAIRLIRGGSGLATLNIEKFKLRGVSVANPDPYKKLDWIRIKKKILKTENIITLFQWLFMENW